MDFKINLAAYLDNDNLKVDAIQFQKMVFMFNAIEDGWTLKKRHDSYVFTKNHEGKKEILHDNYLLEFMTKNMNAKKII